MTLLRGRPDNAPVGVYNNCDKISGTIVSGWSGARTFTKPCKEVVITVGAHGAKVKLSPDGVNWSDEIYIPDRCTAVIPFETHSFNIMSAVTSGWCFYIVTGFYQE